MKSSIIASDSFFLSHMSQYELETDNFCLKKRAQRGGGGTLQNGDFVNPNSVHLELIWQAFLSIYFVFIYFFICLLETVLKHVLRSASSSWTMVQRAGRTSYARWPDLRRLSRFLGHQSLSCITIEKDVENPYFSWCMNSSKFTLIPCSLFFWIKWNLTVKPVNTKPVYSLFSITKSFCSPFWKNALQIYLHRRKPV